MIWLLPLGTSCLRGRTSLAVAASAASKINKIVFFNGKRRIATLRRGSAGLYVAQWQTRAVRRGHHRLRVVVESRSGSAKAFRNVKVCR